MQLIKNVKVFYKDRLNFWLLNITALLIVLGWSLFLFKKIVRSELAVLHYNIYFGFDAIGYWQWLWLMPLISLALTLADFLLAFYIWNKRPIWSHFILSALLLMNLMVLIFLYNIINYNL